MKRVVCGCLLGVSVFIVSLCSAFAQQPIEGSVGWYLQQDRRTKDMLALGIIKGLRMADYIHKYGLKEQGKKCAVELPQYPSKKGYAAIIEFSENYMRNNPDCHDGLIEDVISMTFFVLTVQK